MEYNMIRKCLTLQNKNIMHTLARFIVRASNDFRTRPIRDLFRYTPPAHICPGAHSSADHEQCTKHTPGISILNVNYLHKGSSQSVNNCAKSLPHQFSETD